MSGEVDHQLQKAGPYAEAVGRHRLRFPTLEVGPSDVGELFREAMTDIELAQCQQDAEDEREQTEGMRYTARAELSSQIAVRARSPTFANKRTAARRREAPSR